MGLASAAGEARRHSKRAFTAGRHDFPRGLSHMRKSAVWDATNADDNREPATFRFLLLPPCFPGFCVKVGEAKTAPKGRSYPLIS